MNDFAASKGSNGVGYVQTPDGRSMFIPDDPGGGPPPFDSSLAGAPGAMPSMPPAAPPPIQSPSALNQQAPSPIEAPPGSPPVDVPQPLPEPTPTAAPQQLQPDVNAQLPTPPTPAQKQAAAKQAAYDNSAAGRQKAADTAYAQSQGEGHQAIQANLDAETAKNDATAAALAQGDDDQKRIDAEEKAKRAAYTVTRDQKMAQIDALQNDVNNFKIDPTDGLSSGRHFGMLIAAALSGLGNALAGQGGAANPVLGMMKDAVDQHIRLQMDKRTQMQNRVGQAEQSLNRYENVSKDDLSQFEVQRGLAYKAVARQLDLAANKAANPMAKANAMKAAADLDASGAQHLQAGADRAAQHEFQQQQLASEAAARKQAQANSDRDFKEKVREYDDSLEEKKREAIEKGNAAKAKQIETNQKLGVFDPRTGTSLPSEDGTKTLAAADAIEVQARKDPAGALAAASKALQEKGLVADVKAKLGEMKNPTSADVIALTTQALRDHVKTVEVAQAPDEDAAKKLRPKLAASQNFVDQATKVAEFLKNDPGLTDRKGWAETQANFGSAMKNWAEANEMKFTNREAQALSEHIMSYDPSSFSDRMFGKGPGAASMDTLITNIKQETDATLKANGIKAGWVPAAPDKAETFNGATANQIGQDAEAGGLRRAYDWSTGNNESKTSNALSGLMTPAQKQAVAAQRAGRDLTPDQQKEIDRLGGGAPEETTSERQRKAENAAVNLVNVDGYKIPTNLDEKDARRVIDLSQQYEGATDAKRLAIKQSIVAPIKGNDRPGLASGMLEIIKDQSPDLYRDVLSSLPADRRKEIESRDAALAKIAPKLPPLK